MAKLFARAEYQRPVPDTAPPPSGVWYAIKTNANGEHLAAERLREVFGVYLPVTASIVRAGGLKRSDGISEKALFPGYVFVTNSRPGMFPFYMLRGVQHVAGIVRMDGLPLPIPHGVVAGIMARQIAGAFDHTYEPPKIRNLADAGLSKGQELEITAGAFEGWRIKVHGLTKGREARGFVDMLGRMVQATVPLEALRKVA